MAQIIQHPRAAKTAVVQKNNHGRHPKEIARLRVFRQAKEWARHKAEIKRMEIDAIRNALIVTERAAHTLRYDLARTIQDASKGKS